MSNRITYVRTYLCTYVHTLVQKEIHSYARMENRKTIGPRHHLMQGHKKGYYLICFQTKNCNKGTALNWSAEKLLTGLTHCRLKKIPPHYLLEESNFNFRYIRLLVCVCVCLRPSQPNGVMSSAVSLPSHTFTGQA